MSTPPGASGIFHSRSPGVRLGGRGGASPLSLLRPGPSLGSCSPSSRVDQGGYPILQPQKPPKAVKTVGYVGVSRLEIDYTRVMVLPPAYLDWARSAAAAFRAAGAAPGWDYDAAKLYIAFWAAGLSPRITSLWRDPGHQRELRAAWDRGDRAGLRARPADPDTSLHCQTSVGRPAALAIDMPTTDDTRAARIAQDLGVGAGLAFRKPDPGHYYSLRGRS